MLVIFSEKNEMFNKERLPAPDVYEDSDSDEQDYPQQKKPKIKVTDAKLAKRSSRHSSDMHKISKVN